MDHLNVRTGSYLLLFSLAFSACSKKLGSDLKDELIECREAQADADAGAVVGRMISYTIGLAALAVPQVGVATAIVPVDIGGFFAGLFGSGCDTVEAKLTWFIQVTERRISDLWDTLRTFQENDISRDVGQEVADIEQATSIIRQKIEEIKTDENYVKSGKVPGDALSDVKDQYLELSKQLANIESITRRQSELPYMSGIFQSAVPSAIIAAQDSDNLLAAIQGKTISNASVERQTYDNIKSFRKGFGNLLYTLQNKVEKYPGVEFEVLRAPRVAATFPAGDASCASTSKFRVSFEDEKLEFRIRVFGKPFTTGFVSVKGKEYNIDLGSTFPNCRTAEDHPNFMFALTQMLPEQDTEIKGLLEKVKGLHRSIVVKDLDKLRIWLNWTKDSTASDTFFEGFSRDPAFGSKDRGEAFDDQDYLGNELVQVEEITVRGNDRIDRICLKIRGRAETCHGGMGGKEKKIKLVPGEYITSLHVASKVHEIRPFLRSTQYKVRVFALSLKTSKGQELNWGKWDNTAQHVFEAPTGRQIVGFHGNSGDEVDSLGVIYGTYK